MLGWQQSYSPLEPDDPGSIPVDNIGLLVQLNCAFLFGYHPVQLVNLTGVFIISLLSFS